MTLQDIITQVKSYHPDGDTTLIELGYEFARDAHVGQKRLNGDDYIEHCLATAYHLSKVKMDEATIIAGLLHDVPDETSVPIEEIRNAFGSDIASLVEGIGRLGKIKYRGIDRYVENLRKMFVGIADDIRIIIIKFADRLHNLQTLDALPEDKRLRIAREVLEVYAPIADRLGIGYFKGELEDLAFQYVYPGVHAQVCDIVYPQLQEKEAYLTQQKLATERMLNEGGVHPLFIESRVKHLYSIYQKMLKRDALTLEGIHDLVAMRIVVSSVEECYTTLGIVHLAWKPVPGLIKDYIAQPKPNNYRSLHTTVFCDNGEMVEFQIRTFEMHRESLYGVAAHWNYTESGKKSRKLTKNLKWLQELAQIELRDDAAHEEYLQSLKLDIFKNRIFVFTPKGDVINLPEDATPVDFAYHIHSDIGRRCSGAKVNDHFVSFDTTLKSGDVVEIIVEKNRKFPSVDWLSFVKTHIAKSHIKNQLKGTRSL